MTDLCDLETASNSWTVYLERGTGTGAIRRCIGTAYERPDGTIRIVSVVKPETIDTTEAAKAGGE